MNDARKLKDLFVKARFARCRSRFVVPVILFEGKVKVVSSLFAHCLLCCLQYYYKVEINHEMLLVTEYLQISYIVWRS